MRVPKKSREIKKKEKGTNIHSQPRAMGSTIANLQTHDVTISHTS